MKQTILQWFQAAFPDFDRNQVGDDHGLLFSEFDSVRLNGLPYPDRSELNGNLQCSCGGDVLITWTPKEGMRGRVVLVRDDSTGQTWEAEQIAARAKGQQTPTRMRPHARLRLFYSA